MLKSKTIIVGVTGGIAAYKSCEIVSRLKDLEAEVWVVMTEEATRLVTPLTFRTLSGNPVITDLFSEEIPSLPVPHVSLAQKANIVLIAPCTANILGKVAQGIADDALTTFVMSSTGKKLIAPAMNCEMWRNPMVIENVSKLKNLGYEFIGPVEGKLACGVEDIGRMAEPEEIIDEVVRWLGVRQDLKGKHMLVTAGGTREAIDPVRYISNRSSGKMGYAIARAARERGATVTLISANVDLSSPLDIKPVKVETAAEMLEAALDHYNNADVVIMAAAVADFAPKIKNKKSPPEADAPLAQKIKNKESSINIELGLTVDILKTIAQQKGRKGRILVGFALETENLIENAKQKLKEKDLDLMVANDDSTFGADSIKFSIIDRKFKVEGYGQQAKDQAAHIILDKILSLMP